ncbi:MAG TPA: hypothetical protein VNH11_20350 [Pirellulales bacterium]|nr:hypothetical protein [Pirellulales bacterium]
MATNRRLGSHITSISTAAMLTIGRPLTTGGITPATTRIMGPDHRPYITAIA